MKVACLSGKGGAGKTMTAVNLAAAAERAVYLDCDVEEPNGRLFLKPEGIREMTVSTLLPEFIRINVQAAENVQSFADSTS